MNFVAGLRQLPEGCLRLYQDEGEAFLSSPGSSHNHQSWEGGWLDHTKELFDISEDIYQTLNRRRPLPFTLEEAWLVLFLHDLEKPFKYKGSKNHPTWQEEASADAEKFKERLIQEYDIPLSSEQRNALKYVHGELDDYRSDKRVAGRLAAFCHTIDYLSARLWYDYPIKENQQ